MDGPATWAYRDRFTDAFARTYFRRFGDGVVSSIGVGTYLGDASDAADDRYRAALVEALESGVNVVDTAVNYRHGRSERVVGEALARADVDPAAALVATKGGFVAFDGERPTDPAGYVADRYGDLGELHLVDGNCIDPAFIERQLDRSRGTLGVDLGLYYLHNPETQLAERSRAAVYDAIEDAFTLLERRVAADDIGGYGVATWDCFRVPRDHPRYLSLAEVVRRAASDRAGTEATGFRAIHLPFNVRMADAFTVEAHEGPGGLRSALALAHDAGLAVFASAPLLQGDLATEGAIPEAVADRLAGDGPAQRAINFARSAPGVTAALVGTGSPEHVAENVAAGTFPPLGAAAFDATFE
jgi:aryl-alcohol dehydrogenase-like predicted oxidoreductase